MRLQPAILSDATTFLRPANASVARQVLALAATATASHRPRVSAAGQELLPARSTSIPPVLGAAAGTPAATRVRSGQVGRPRPRASSLSLSARSPDSCD